MRVFISYSRKDVNAAESVELALRRAGHEPYRDERDIQTGADFREEIRLEIGRADAMLFLLSRHSVDPQAFTAIELQMARDRWQHPAGRLLPIRLDDVPLEQVPEFVKAAHIEKPAAGDVATAAVRVVSRLQRSVRWRHVGLRVALALGLLIVYPLLIPLVSAFVLRGIDRAGADGLHDWYARQVRAAYKVDDRAIFGRLDYHQLLEFKSNGRDLTEFRLPVLPMQQVEFRVESVHARSESSALCALPRQLGFKGAELIQVGLGPGNVPAFKLRQGVQTVFALDAARWRQIDQGGRTGLLEVGFQPLQSVSQACDEALAIDVKVSVKVFKSLVERASAASVGSDQP